MSKFISLIFIILTHFTYAQTCNTKDGKLINCTDTAGLKQGYWEHTKKNILLSSFGELGSKDGCNYDEYATYYPIAKGYYKHNRKIGVWEYYALGHSSFLEIKEHYINNGSVILENFLDNYKLEISKDSLTIIGELFHPLDTLVIQCMDSNCSIQLSNKRELMHFEFIGLDRLEYELLRLRMGEYNRKINYLLSKR